MRIVTTIATVMAGLALGAVSVAHAATQVPAVQSGGLVSHVSSSSADLSPAQTRSPLYGVAIRSSGALPSLAQMPAGPSMAEAFGRDFTADLDGLLWSDSFQDTVPFATAMQTGFGTVTASGYAVRTTTPDPFAAQLGRADDRRYGLRDFQLAMSVAPGVTVRAGYRTRMAGRINGYDAFGSGAYDGLFFSASAVNSPYLSLTDGGNYLQTSVRIADGLDLHFGAASLDRQQAEFAVPVFSTLDQLRNPQRFANLRQAQATEAGVSWNFARWGGLGVTASNITERNGLLGGVNSNSLSMLRSAKTTAIGLTARFGFGEGWVTTVSYNEGITRMNLQPNGIGSNADTFRSRAFGVAVAKHGLFGNSDSLGLALSRPVQVYNGGVNLAPISRVDSSSALGLGYDHVSLAGATPETDVELGYTTTFFDGALALQANAGYQMNFAGQSGTNALTVLSRAKINF